MRLKGKLDKAKKVVVCVYAFKAQGSKRGVKKVKPCGSCKRSRRG